jgi:hypothetical protein
LLGFVQLYPISQPALRKIIDPSPDARVTIKLIFVYKFCSLLARASLNLELWRMPRQSIDSAEMYGNIRDSIPYAG